MLSILISYRFNISFLTILFIGFRLEETLIDLYLSGYNGPVDADNGAVMPLETVEGDNFKFSVDGLSQLIFAFFYQNFCVLIVGAGINRYCLNAESSNTHKLEELNAESSNTLELEEGELIMEDLGEGLSYITIINQLLDVLFIQDCQTRERIKEIHEHIGRRPTKFTYLGENYEHFYMQVLHRKKKIGDHNMVRLFNLRKSRC